MKKQLRPGPQRAALERGPNSPFVIFTMPTALDAWFAHWLRCGYGGLMQSEGIDAWFEGLRHPPYGTVEPSCPVIWRVLRQRVPDAKIMVVNKPITQILDDGQRNGRKFDRNELYTHFQVIEVIANAPGVGALELPMEDPRAALATAWRFLMDKAPLDEDWLDQCLESSVAIPRLAPSHASIRLHVEAIAESRKLGGSAGSLWLN